jgi:hypothetical protein
MKRMLIPLAAALVLLGAPVPARAADPVVQSADEALAQDAAAIAPRLGTSLSEALQRLRAQDATVATSDRLRVQYRDRFAGLFVEQVPAMRIVVLLTGSETPPPFTVAANGLEVPVEFRSGAAATREQVLAAIDLHRSAIAAAVPGFRGVGHDPRSGAMLAFARASAAVRPLEAIEAELAALTGVPVRVRLLSANMENASAVGGGRLEGRVGDRRFYCTTGFVVRQGGTLGVTTAAHCADDMTYRGPDGEERLLEMVGSWGEAYRDVQVHTGVGAAPPLVFSDRERSRQRPVTGWRTRPQTRVGDIVCLRGESSGHACSLVELTDFAPPGELCGGLCAASWVAVAGPDCRRGDSGSPVFLGTTAYGLLKGGAYLPGGGCAFYYYMSTDYLPEEWRVVTAPTPASLSVNGAGNPGREPAR